VNVSTYQQKLALGCRSRENNLSKVNHFEIILIKTTNHFELGGWENKYLFGHLTKLNIFSSFFSSINNRKRSYSYLSKDKQQTIEVHIRSILNYRKNLLEKESQVIIPSDAFQLFFFNIILI
jgi:hypothetical protein